jgi:hypothetical protein
VTELSDPAVEALWKNVLDHWDEEKAHLAFLETCRERGKLAEAATRYRGMAADRDRSEEAEKRLKSILAIAMAQLETSRSPEAVVKRRASSFAVLVLLIAGTIALFIYTLGIR